MKQPYLSLFIHHALVLTIIFGTIYTIVQQNYRTSANDPQIQMAEDAARDLNRGVSLQSFGPIGPTRDIAESIAPFTVIYDTAETAIIWTGTLDGKPPVLPDGVLEYAQTNGENHVTWQPEKDIRIAAVIKPFTGQGSGYVLVGRSLREVEEREYQLMLFVGVGWVLSLAVDVFCVWVRRRTM